MPNPFSRGLTDKPKSTENPKTDPLYVFLEQHLLSFQDPDMDRKTLILTVVQDYLTFLRKRNIIVPKSLEGAIVDELASQVNTMLVKKIYGCVSITEYQTKVPKTQKRRAKSRYSRLKKTA